MRSNGCGGVIDVNLGAWVLWWRRYGVVGWVGQKIGQSAWISNVGWELVAIEVNSLTGMDVDLRPFFDELH